MSDCGRWPCGMTTAGCRDPGCTLNVAVTTKEIDDRLALRNQPISKDAPADTTRAVRQALEKAALAIEARSGNEIYRKAWKIAARIVREQKPD